MEKQIPYITQEEALEKSNQFLREQEFAKKYHSNPSFVTLREDEYFFEYKELTGHSRPGVCIITVNKKTGAIRLSPVC